MYFLVALISVSFLFTTFVLCRTTFDVSEFNKCPPQDSKFITLVDRSVDQCVEECARRKQCHVLGYKSLLQLCELHMTSTTPAHADNRCVMIQQDDIKVPKQYTCGDWHVSDVIDRVEPCKVKECRPQLPLENGQLLGNKNEIGSKKAVVCNHGFIEENNLESVVCLKGGWSHNASCVLKECPDSNGEIKLGATFRLKIYREKKNQRDAVATCKGELDGHLVVLDKEWKMSAVSKILSSCPDYKNGNDYWTDGKCKYNVSYQCHFTDGNDMPMSQATMWHTGSPNDKDSGCVRVQSKHGVYRWNDRNCSLNFPFICEY